MGEEKLTAEKTANDKKRDLFLSQKATLDTFLACGAITQAQYDKSLGCLKEKMGFDDPE